MLENASDMATTLIGTPYYMSPELFSGKPYSYKVYIYITGYCRSLSIKLLKVASHHDKGRQSWRGGGDGVDASLPVFGFGKSI